MAGGNGGTDIQAMVDRQIGRVLEKGSRFTRFDQIRQRHFWSTYLFAPGGGGIIAAAAYEIFVSPTGMPGQGYPTNVPLTLRETNWRNARRVPDNQNFVITEIGVEVKRPPPCDNDGAYGVPAHAPIDGIFANLPTPVQANVAPAMPTHPFDAAALLYGGVLEMSYLTNNIPIGWLADFSQPGGVYAFDSQTVDADALGFATNTSRPGDPVNGVPAAAFRRKLEVPILLQHGEQASMTIRIPRAITLLSLAEGGTGWAEIKVDWWATESFVEKS
jgi:hypothetical protein